jgi:hypothetical protein
MEKATLREWRPWPYLRWRSTRFSARWRQVKAWATWRRQFSKDLLSKFDELIVWIRLLNNRNQ